MEGDCTVSANDCLKIIVIDNPQMEGDCTFTKSDSYWAHVIDNPQMEGVIAPLLFTSYLI